MNRSKNFTFYSAVLALIMFFAAGTSMSQSRIKLGFEAGLNLANVSFSPSVTTGTRTGLIFGGVIEAGFNPQFALVSGLRYIMKGTEVTSTNSTTVSKANYLEIPALLKVKFPMTEVKPYLIAGPTLGLKLSASTRTDFGTTGGNDVDNPNVESTDFGLFFGAGIDFGLNPNVDLYFQPGYSLGLSNVSKTQGQTAKTNGIQLVAGVKFKM